MSDFPQQPQPPYAPQPPPPPGAAPQTNGLAVASMVCGIVSVAMFWLFFVGIPLAVVAVVLGFVGNRKAAEMGGAGKGMAVAGIVTGAVGLIAGIVIVILAVATQDEAEQILQELESEFGMVLARLGL